MRKAILAFALVFIVAAPFLAVSENAPALKLGTSAAKVDGVFDGKEYSLVTDAAGIRLGLAWTADTLYVGVSALTTGWVAAGIGSLKMDSAVMYLGRAAGASGEMKIQKGSGHRHADLQTAAPPKYAIHQAGGTTVLELALPVDTVIAADQTTLKLILATGTSDSFTSFHKARAGLTVDLAR